jgi:hypothetical protein
MESEVNTHTGKSVNNRWVITSNILGRQKVAKTFNNRQNTDRPNI